MASNAPDVQRCHHEVLTLGSQGLWTCTAGDLQFHAVIPMEEAQIFWMIHPTVSQRTKSTSFNMIQCLIQCCLPFHSCNPIVVQSSRWKGSNLSLEHIEDWDRMSLGSSDQATKHARWWIARAQATSLQGASYQPGFNQSS